MRDLVARAAMAGVVPMTIVGVGSWTGEPLRPAVLAPLLWGTMALAAVLVLQKPARRERPAATEPERLRTAA